MYDGRLPFMGIRLAPRNNDAPTVIGAANDFA